MCKSDTSCKVKLSSTPSRFPLRLNFGCLINQYSLESKRKGHLTQLFQGHVCIYRPVCLEMLSHATSTEGNLCLCIFSYHMLRVTTSLPYLVNFFDVPVKS